MSKAQEVLKRIENLSQMGVPDGWERVDQVSTSRTTQRILVYGSIVGALLCGFLGYTVFKFDTLHELRTLTDAYGKNVILGSIAISVFVMLLIHEAIHLVCLPNFGRTQNTIVGFNLLSLFVVYLDQMSINRFLLMLLAPVSILGVALASFAIVKSEFFVLAAILLVVNVGSSLGDVAMAARVSKIRKTHGKIWNLGTHYIALRRSSPA